MGRRPIYYHLDDGDDTEWDHRKARLHLPCVFHLLETETDGTNAEEGFEENIPQGNFVILTRILCGSRELKS